VLYPIPEIIALDRVDSTNNYAMGLIKSNRAGHGTAVFTSDQPAGRRKKIWESEPEKNIALSVITDMQSIPIHFQPFFSMWASLRVASFIEKTANLKAFVKWPNDIFIHDKKSVGILIENIIRGPIWQWAVTGIGMNVNQEKFPNDYNATSLKIETGRYFDVSDLASELRETFLKDLPIYLPRHPDLLLKLYNERLYKKDEIVKLQSGSRVFESKIAGVNKQGKLVTEDTCIREWNMDEVKMKV